MRPQPVATVSMCDSRMLMEVEIFLRSASFNHLLQSPQAKEAYICKSLVPQFFHAALKVLLADFCMMKRIISFSEAFMGEVSVWAGAAESIEILVWSGTDQDITFSSGSTLDIKLHTAAGKEYPRLIELT